MHFTQTLTQSICRRKVSGEGSRAGGRLVSSSRLSLCGSASSLCQTTNWSCRENKATALHTDISGLADRQTDGQRKKRERFLYLVISRMPEMSHGFHERLPQSPRAVTESVQNSGKLTFWNEIPTKYKHEQKQYVCGSVWNTLSAVVCVIGKQATLWCCGVFL